MALNSKKFPHHCSTRTFPGLWPLAWFYRTQVSSELLCPCFSASLYSSPSFSWCAVLPSGPCWASSVLPSVPDLHQTSSQGGVESQAEKITRTVEESFGRGAAATVHA